MITRYEFELSPETAWMFEVYPVYKSPNKDKAYFILVDDEKEPRRSWWTRQPQQK